MRGPRLMAGCQPINDRARAVVALVCLAIQANRVFEIRYGAASAEFEGLGGDGTNHVTLAGRLGVLIANQDANIYDPALEAATRQRLTRSAPAGSRRSCRVGRAGRMPPVRSWTK